MSASLSAIPVQSLSASMSASMSSEKCDDQTNSEPDIVDLYLQSLKVNGDSWLGKDNILEMHAW